MFPPLQCHSGLGRPYTRKKKEKLLNSLTALAALHSLSCSHARTLRPLPPALRQLPSRRVPLPEGPFPSFLVRLRATGYVWFYLAHRLGFPPRFFSAVRRSLLLRTDMSYERRLRLQANFDVMASACVIWVRVVPPRGCNL
eukprot:scaffold15135_cov32-Tisochrysis_lutea.AAC.3